MPSTVTELERRIGEMADRLAVLEAVVEDLIQAILPLGPAPEAAPNKNETQADAA